MTSMTAAVSFAVTPLDEISSKVEAIRALGWTERKDGRGDPWAASFVKDFPDDRFVCASVVISFHSIDRNRNG